MATHKEPQRAKAQQLPDKKIFSIEFPGHVQNLNKVKEALGGDHAITNATTKRYKVKRQPGSKRSLPPYRAPREDDELYNEDEEPELQFEIVGSIPRTARFSGLADYQHIMDPRDPIFQVKKDLQNMEFENLIAVQIDNTDAHDDITTTQLIPPAVIAKSTVPNPYRYKARDRDDEVKGKPGRKTTTAKHSLQSEVGENSSSVHIDSNESDYEL
ncbi:hypothetical protein EDD11_002304 [Mortierella claussenii]|nr:hypothetical protein EDD11_002304 [Mortierella claussenii]